MIENKKIAFLGDSITFGCGASDKKYSFVEVFQRETKSNCVNLGISGSRISYQTAPSVDNLYWDKFYETRLDEIPSDSDIIVVFGGTNDFGHGDAPLGKMGDKTVLTFYGALYQLMSKLKVVFPSSKIVFATPLKREWDEREVSYREKPVTLDEFREAIISSAKLFDLPVIDLYNLFDVNPKNEEEKMKYMPDGLHPSDDGHALLAEIFKNELEKLA